MAFDFERVVSRAASIGQSRSSILNPLQWMIVVFVSALVGVAYVHAEHWLLVLMAVLLCSTFALFAAAFLYFMVHEPTRLRSEDLEIYSKMLEKGLFPPSMATQLVAQQKRMDAGQKIEITDIKELGEIRPERSMTRKELAAQK